MAKIQKRFFKYLKVWTLNALYRNQNSKLNNHKLNCFYNNTTENHNQIIDNHNDKIKKTIFINIVNNKAGIFYNTTKQYQNAITFFDEAFKVSILLNYKVGVATSLSSLKFNYEEQGNYSFSMKGFKNKLFKKW